jgi:hypothetical protein
MVDRGDRFCAHWIASAVQSSSPLSHLLRRKGIPWRTTILTTNATLFDPDGSYLRKIQSSVLLGKDEESEDDLGDLVATVENEGIFLLKGYSRQNASGPLTGAKFNCLEILEAARKTFMGVSFGHLTVRTRNIKQRLW